MTRSIIVIPSGIALLCNELSLSLSRARAYAPRRIAQCWVIPLAYSRPRRIAIRHAGQNYAHYHSCAVN